MFEYNESHRQRLIVTADDFGVSPRANRNILYLISLGKIDRVAVMANGKFSQAEIEKLARSGVKIDIHLDILNEFHDDRKQRTGNFLRILEFTAKLLTRKITTKKVFEDWKKQFKKFHEIFGKNPDGINSHEHVHFFPPFFDIALKLQQQHMTPYVRFGNSLNLRQHAPKALILNWLRVLNRKKFTKSGCVSSDSLISLDWIEDVEKFLDNLPDGTIEITTHPEIADELEKIKKYF